MLDDELLPKNHPLQLYLEELDLNETSPDVNTQPAPVGDPEKPSLSKKFTAFMTKTTSLLHPWAFDFAEHFRKGILDHAEDFIDETNAAVMRRVYHTDCRPNTLRSIFFLLSLGVILPFSLLMTSSGLITQFVWFMWLLSSMFVVLCALCIYAIHRLLLRCTMQMKLVHTPLKICLSFLQEIDHHSSFGASHLSLLCTQTAWSFPTLQERLGRCLRFYNEQLISLELQVNEVISLLSNEFTCGLSSSDLQPLKERVSSEQLTFILRQLKMLREVALLLESDLVGKVIGVICAAPIHSILIWARLTILLRNFLRELKQLKEPLDRLDRLREYVQCGGLDFENSELVPTPSEEFEKHTTSTANPATRVTKTILMHLLVAIQSMRSLEGVIEKHDTGGETPSDWKAILGHLRCQLNACNNSLDELERIFWPENTEEMHAAPDEEIAGQEPFCFKSLEQATTRTTLKAQDIDPEDDVLEDVALGDDSNDEVESADEFDSDINTVVPLHSSVLKELRNAIAYRRLTMEEREQKALQKRTMNSQITPATESSQSTKLNTTTADETPLFPSIVSSEPSILTVSSKKDSKGINLKQTDVRVNEDPELESFFSQLPIATGVAPSESVQKRLLRRCSWQPRSAVKTRTDLFRRFSTRPTGEDDRLISRHPTGVPTRIPLPGMVAQPTIVPTIPGAHVPVRPFLPDQSFASALLAQRRKVGYTDEESFTAVGTGEEELPEPVNPKNEPIKNGSLPS